MKTLIPLLLIWCGTVKGMPSLIYVQCFDSDYSYLNNISGTIQIHDQVFGSSRYNANANIKINGVNQALRGFVRYDGDPALKTFRFFGSHIYYENRLSGFKFLFGTTLFGAEISYGMVPSFTSRVVKLRCDFSSKSFPNYHVIH